MDRDHGVMSLTKLQGPCKKTAVAVARQKNTRRTRERRDDLNHFYRVNDV